MVRSSGDKARTSASEALSLKGLRASSSPAAMLGVGGDSTNLSRSIQLEKMGGLDPDKSFGFRSKEIAGPRMQVIQAHQTGRLGGLLVLQFISNFGYHNQKYNGD